MKGWGGGIGLNEEGGGRRTSGLRYSNGKERVGLSIGFRRTVAVTVRAEIRLRGLAKVARTDEGACVFAWEAAGCTLQRGAEVQRYAVGEGVEDGGAKGGTERRRRQNRRTGGVGLVVHKL